ncbi:MAG: AraC family transcriptional regulator [Bacteroidota bacterium]
MIITREEVQPDAFSSFTLKSFSEKNRCQYPYWHVHSEYEIMFLNNGSGKRQVGNHFSLFQDGELMLLGPNIPHFGLGIDPCETYNEIILQINPSFFESSFFKIPEMQSIQGLLRRARGGISFKDNTKVKVGEILFQMTTSNDFTRIQKLLALLKILSDSKEFEVLNLAGYNTIINEEDHSRIQLIFGYIEKHYQETIDVKTLASLINMTVPSFCRFFRKSTNKTLTRFVNEFRISKACELLSQTKNNISWVGFAKGFNNLSHFNKQFKLITGVNPKEYRKYWY